MPNEPEQSYHEMINEYLDKAFTDDEKDFLLTRKRIHIKTLILMIQNRGGTVPESIDKSEIQEEDFEKLQEIDDVLQDRFSELTSE